MRRLGWRFAICPLAILALLIAALGESGLRAIESAAVAAARVRLAGTVALLEPEARAAWLAPDEARPGALAAFAGTAAARAGVRVTLFGSSGAVLADSAEKLGLQSREGDRQEVVAARTDEVAFALREVPYLPHRVAFFARRLDEGGRPLGVIRVAEESDLVDGRQGRFRDLVLVLGLVALIAIGVVALRTARLVTRPVRAITAAATALSHGDFDPQLDEDDVAPFGELAGAITAVARNSRDRTEAGASDRNKVLAILGAMVEGVLAVDLEQRVLHVNGAAQRILGLSSSHPEGRRVLELARVPEVHAILANVLARGREEHGELRVVGPPRDRWVELHASPLRGPDQLVVGAVLVLHDVTELRRLEAVRRDFVANVSHELKTPIAAIRGMVETVLDDPEMDEALRRRFLARSKEQVLRLSALVSDLLTLSRVESGGQLREPQRVDLREPVEDALAHLRGIAEDKGIATEAQLAEDELVVLGDADSLRLVATNLIDNALKYTPAKGHVTVRLSRGPTHAILEVKDDGIGIERKHLDRIFQRFYRVDQARSRELGGTGLGLSIVKHVVLAHGGDVNVESSPGQGSLFRVRIPLA
ncbi:MAG: PAS domain-containing protein [Planctomycetes bacterium]|nr:PAS domain-containing protein [Planctomycetota bacterium]